VHEKKPRRKLLHRGLVADEFEADFIIGDRLVAELKVLWGGFAPEHLLQVICYLKFWRLDAGLLLDFGKESLAQKRVPRIDRVAEFDPVVFRDHEPPGRKKDAVLCQMGEAIGVILAEHGLGYRDRTYRGLIFAELSYRKIPCQREVVVAVRSEGRLLGDANVPCLVLPGHGALFVTALRESHQAADRAVLHTYVRLLGVPWGLHINFGKTRIDCQWVEYR
jgi:GxxExxY protein